MEINLTIEGITMQLPVSLDGITLWLGAMAILLLVTSEFISPYYRHIGLTIEKKRLRQAALIFSTLFLLIAIIRIYEIFTY
jgi:hypothetical protein